jgi:hypothetical protein
MRRELIERTDAGMAVIDYYRDKFVAGVIVADKRPIQICRTIGVFDTRKEAIDAATAALAGE